MTLVYMFPGQGSQQTGMGAEIFRKYPHLVTQANDILGFDIEDICLSKEKADHLNNTRYTQPALFVVNALMYLDRVEAVSRFPNLVLGHSLGEFNALHAAGVFNFSMGVEIVNHRAKLMSKINSGAMSAVIGMSEAELKNFIDSYNLNIDIANINTQTQMIISGAQTDIEAIGKKLKYEKEVIVKRLNVGGAFHSQYMVPVSHEFRDVLSDFQFSTSTITIIANINAQPYKMQSVLDCLSQQLSSPVRWFDSIQYIKKTYTEVIFDEVGPGNVLTGITKQCCKSIEDGEDVF